MKRHSIVVRGGDTVSFGRVCMMSIITSIDHGIPVFLDCYYNNAHRAFCVKHSKATTMFHRDEFLNDVLSALHLLKRKCPIFLHFREYPTGLILPSTEEVILVLDGLNDIYRHRLETIPKTTYGIWVNPENFRMNMDHCVTYIFFDATAPSTTPESWKGLRQSCRNDQRVVASTCSDTPDLVRPIPDVDLVLIDAKAFLRISVRS